MQRLDHQITWMRGMEAPHILDPASDERWRHEPGVIEHEHLLGRIAHRCGIVDHQSTAFQPFEQMRRGDIPQIERRILPHQHHVDIMHEVDQAKFAAAVVVVLHRLNRDRRAPCGQRPGSPHAGVISQRAHIVMEQLMPPRLRRQHQRERRIARDIDGFERVHLDSDA